MSNEAMERDPEVTEESSAVATSEVQDLHAEVARLQQQAADSEAEKKMGRHTGRRWAVGLLIVLGCILLAGTNRVTWLRDVVLDTDGWVAAVGPLSQNETIANTVSVYVVGELFDAVDVTSLVQEALPQEVKVVSGPLVAALQNLAGEATAAAIQTDQFNAVWETANRAAHTVAMEALRDSSGLVYLQSGQLTIDVSGILDFVQDSVDLQALGLSPEEDWGKFVLLESHQVAQVQQALDILNTLGWLFPLLTLVAFFLAWLVSLWRRRTVMWIGVGMAVTMVVMLIALALVKPVALSYVADPVMRAVAGEVWNTIQRGYIIQTVLLFVLGLLLALGAWVAGSSPQAVGIRSGVRGWSDNLKS